MQQRAAITQDLVLVGGGHAHVHVLKSFGMRPMPGVRVTLVARDVETPYSGMLPGYVAGHYTFEECHIDLGRLVRFAGARLIRDEAIGLDRNGHSVLCRAHPPIRWDLLSIDIGSAPRTNDVPGAAAHAIAVKPIARFAARWEALLARARAIFAIRLRSSLNEIGGETLHFRTSSCQSSSVEFEISTRILASSKCRSFLNPKPSQSAATQTERARALQKRPPARPHPRSGHAFRQFRRQSRGRR